MSQHNVEVFKRGADAYDRRDAEAFLEDAHPDVEWRPAFQMLLGGSATVFRGHDAIRRMFREVDESLAAIGAEWSDIRDLGERVVATGRLRIRGRESGVESESPVGIVVDFSEGKVVRVQTFLDPAQALDAAGLSE
jgi:ketosteroid isomerase-like protein